MRTRNEGSGVLVEALLGAAAGAAAIWVMDRFDWFAFEHVDPGARRRTQSVRPGGMDPAHVAADRIAGATGTDLHPRQENSAGLAVHYSFGVAPGALYGALRHQVPELTAGKGLLFGFGIFLLEDEVLNPALGLAARPADYPWQAHARGFFAHLVYGLVLDALLTGTDELRRRSTHG